MADLTSQQRKDLQSIVDALNEFLPARLAIDEPFVLDDFAELGDYCCPLNGAAGIAWVEALHKSLSSADAAASTLHLWNMFGDLLPIGYDERRGPIYVSKRSATLQHLVDAIQYTNPAEGGAVQ